MTKTARITRMCQRKNDLPAGLAATETPRCGPHRYHHHGPINIISNSSAGWLILLTMVEQPDISIEMPRIDGACRQAVQQISVCCRSI